MKRNESHIPGRKMDIWKCFAPSQLASQSIHLQKATDLYESQARNILGTVYILISGTHTLS